MHNFYLCHFSYTEETLVCIKKSTLSCDSDLVLATYTRFFAIQASSGITCVSPCASSPCQNGGICTVANAGTSYQCTCPTGYAGNNCDVGKQRCVIVVPLRTIADQKLLIKMLNLLFVDSCLVTHSSPSFI